MNEKEVRREIINSISPYIQMEIRKLSMDVVMGEISQTYFEGKIRQLIIDSIIADRSRREIEK